MTAEPEFPAIEAEKVAREYDVVKACEYLTALPDPAAAAKGFHELVRRSWRAKNVPAMIQYGQAGIQYALQASAKLGDTDAKLAAQLRSQAKAIAYDVSSNLWPGWDEPGITLSPTDLTIGLQLAKTNLRLAKELDRIGDPLGHAWWLVGAHELAARNLPFATAAFVEAEKHYQGDYAEMTRGYSSLVQQLNTDAAQQIAGRRDFEKIMKTLRESKGSDGKFFASQLETATKVFLTRPEPGK